MSRAQGTPKTGGRAKGTPNKKTEVLQDLMDQKQFNPFEHLISTLPQLEPSLQAKICIDLMAYIYPKRKAMDVVIENNSDYECPNCTRYSSLSEDKQKEKIRTFIRIAQLNDPDYFKDLLG